MHHHQNNLQNS